MMDSPKVAGSPLPRAGWRDRRFPLHDLLGVALLVAVLALWVTTWAAVAGPLRPSEVVRAEEARLATQAATKLAESGAP